MDARMPRQFVAARKSFLAARKGARMRFLSCVRANVSCLVLEPVEGLIAHGAFVGSGKFLFAGANARHHAAPILVAHLGQIGGGKSLPHARVRGAEVYLLAGGVKVSAGQQGGGLGWWVGVCMGYDEKRFRGVNQPNQTRKGKER